MSKLWGSVLLETKIELSLCLCHSTLRSLISPKSVDGQGVNSTYIREGSEGLTRKVGYHCMKCDAYYDLTSEKLYTVNTKTVHSNFNREEQESGSFCQNKEPWPGFGPGTFALPRLESLLNKVPSPNPVQGHYL